MWRVFRFWIEVVVGEYIWRDVEDKSLESF